MHQQNDKDTHQVDVVAVHGDLLHLARHGWHLRRGHRAHAGELRHRRRVRRLHLHHKALCFSSSPLSFGTTLEFFLFFSFLLLWGVFWKKKLSPCFIVNCQKRNSVNTQKAKNIFIIEKPWWTLATGIAIDTYLWVPGHAVDTLGWVRVGAAARGWVDVAHHAVAGRHHGAQRLGELLLLLSVLCSAILEPNLRQEETESTSVFFTSHACRLFFGAWLQQPLNLSPHRNCSVCVFLKRWGWGGGRWLFPAFPFPREVKNFWCWHVAMWVREQQLARSLTAAMIFNYVSTVPSAGARWVMLIGTEQIECAHRKSGLQWRIPGAQKHKQTAW